MALATTWLRAVRLAVARAIREAWLLARCCRSLMAAQESWGISKRKPTATATATVRRAARGQQKGPTAVGPGGKKRNSAER
jgi:hypothetical protein